MTDAARRGAPAMRRSLLMTELLRRTRPTHTPQWTVLVPVKRFAYAKTRLAPEAGRHRDELALALACDTVEAVTASAEVGEVIVITNEPAAAASLRALGATVIADVPDAGLNPALEYAAAVASGRATRVARVAALSADLAALRPAELDAALLVAGEHPRAFVVDQAGDGTTLLTARDGVALRPAFGAWSATLHRTSGAYEITGGGLDSLRLDIDTGADLRRARTLGLGPRSAKITDLIYAD